LLGSNEGKKEGKKMTANTGSGLTFDISPLFFMSNVSPTPSTEG